MEKAEIGELDAAASPLGAGLRASELLLRLPQPLAGPGLRLWLRLAAGVSPAEVGGNPHCGGNGGGGGGNDEGTAAARCRALLPCFNAELVQLAARVGVECPAHRSASFAPPSVASVAQHTHHARPR